MICTNCNEAYNGSDRRCHMCGTVYPPDPLPVIERTTDDPIESAVIKKKSHKKGAGKRSLDNNEEE